MVASRAASSPANANNATQKRRKPRKNSGGGGGGGPSGGGGGKRTIKKKSNARPKPAPTPLPSTSTSASASDASDVDDVPWGRPAEPWESSEPVKAQQVTKRIHRDFDATRVRSARYVVSSVTIDQCPNPPTPPNFSGKWVGFPDFAFIGRSNVGKSSLINSITGTDGLALVSKTPGKTKAINHFLINECWYLVDLPGYGYAKTVGRQMRDVWANFTMQYFLERRRLCNVFVLIDGTVPTQEIDRQVVTWLADNDIPHSIVFTKCDKKNKKSGPPYSLNVEAFKRDVLAEIWDDEESMPQVFITSSVSNQGKQALLGYIKRLRSVWSGAIEADSSAE